VDSSLEQQLTGLLLEEEEEKEEEEEEEEKGAWLALALRVGAVELGVLLCTVRLSKGAAFNGWAAIKVVRARAQIMGRGWSSARTLVRDNFVFKRTA